MKTQSKLGRVTLKAVLALVFVAPFFSSCVDLDEVWNKFDEVEARLDSLETSVNNQILALDNLLSGQIKISECKKNDDGSHSIVLSDGTKFTVYPKSTEYNTLLTYVEEGGVKYWAVYDAAGSVKPLVGKDGKKIPVEAELPSVKEVDGEYVITIAGQEYTTGFSIEDIVTVFSSYELLKDDSGNVYAVKFTFGENMTFTVPLVDYKGFSFHIVGDINATVIKNYYVGFGETARVMVGLEGVVDYVMQIPDGWRVKEVKNESTYETYLDITAPAEATVLSGAAVSGGELKVVAVVEDGKSMVAKLELSTVPFRRVAKTATNAIIEKYNGVDKIIYGLSKFDDYDPKQILAGADALLKANDKGVADSDVNKPLAEIFGAELNPEDRYVLWAIPAFYYTAGEEAGFKIKEGLIFSHEFGAISVNLDVDKITFNAASLSVKLAGITSYYGGTVAKTEGALDDILYQINNELLDPYTEPMTYLGSAFEFPTALSNNGIEILSGESYLTWIVPVDEEKNTYSKEDVVFKEFTLSNITSGGSVTVTSADATINRTSISVPLTAENAVRIYYMWLDQSGYRVVKDNDEKKVEELLAKGVICQGNSASAVIDKIRPAQKRYLLAMAVDSEGKYGAVLDANYTTSSMSYNSISVKVDLVDVGQNNATLSVTATGGTATEYVYWVGRDTDEFWLAQDKLKTTAEEYIACFPDDGDIASAMRKYTLTDGVLTLSDLKGESNYIVLVLAKDADGVYSHAGYKKFTTLAVDLGEVVKTGTAEWEAAKAQIQIEWNQNMFRLPASNMGYAVYGFDITIPSIYTAYIWCIADAYFEENTEIRTMAEKIIDIETYCSRKYDADRVPRDSNGEYLQEPDWIDDSGTVHNGTLMNVYDFYVHGYPTNGFATYFAADAHGANCCISWEGGKCSNYERALNSIEKMCSLDYYKQYLSDNRKSYLSQEANLNKAAEDLYNAYLPYYKDAKPLIYINNGDPLHMEQHNGAGLDPNDETKVVDDVYVVLIDAAGNYYEPMVFDVPNYFK